MSETILRWAEEDVWTGAVWLHIRRVVAPVARPIVLLHGLGVSGAVWQPFARRLAPEFSAVAPDLRGHGLSGAPPTGYEPGDYAADLAGLVEALLDPPIPVVGHSLGALVALTLAHDFPALVSHAVLVDPPFDPAIQNRDVANVARLRREPGDQLEAYLAEQNPGGGMLLAKNLASWFRQAVDQAYEALLQDPAGHPVTAALARTVTCPVLLIRADPEVGGVLGEIAAQNLVSRAPRASLLSIPGATHAVHSSNPGVLAGAIKEFVLSS